MGNNQHLKRNAAPTAWPIKRKNITFIAKPNPGSHKSKYVTPVVVILRDVLGYAETSKEVKLIVHNEEILVNNKKVQDIKFPVGLFDIIEIKKTAEKYIALFDTVGKIKLIPTKDNTAYLKITNKTQLSNKKYQLNFMNGFNTLVDEKTFKSVKVNDSVVFDLNKSKISSVLNLKEGNYVFLFEGKFKGQFGEVKGFTLYNGLTRDLVQIQIGDEVHSTAKDYAYVVGSKKTDLKRFE